MSQKICSYSTFCIWCWIPSVSTFPPNKTFTQLLYLSPLSFFPPNALLLWNSPLVILPLLDVALQQAGASRFVCVCVCVGEAVADVESRRTSESFTCLTCTCTGLGWYPPTALPFSTKGARHPAGDNYCSHSLFVDAALKKGVCLWWMRVSLANVGRTSFLFFFLPSSAFPITDVQTGCRQSFSSTRRPSVWGWMEATRPRKMPKICRRKRMPACRTVNWDSMKRTL